MTDGKLKKQYVNVGVSTDGYSIPVKSGIIYGDKIAFPYGKGVKEGRRHRKEQSMVSMGTKCQKRKFKLLFCSGNLENIEPERRRTYAGKYKASFQGIWSHKMRSF